MPANDPMAYLLPYLTNNPPMASAGNPVNMAQLLGVDAVERMGVQPTDAALSGGIGGYGMPDYQQQQPAAPTPAPAAQDPIAQAIALLQQKEPPTEAVSPQKLKTYQKILGVIADGLAGYAAGLQGRPSPPSVIGQLRQRRQEEAEGQTRKLETERGERISSRREEAGLLIEKGKYEREQESRKRERADIRAERDIEKLDRQMREAETQRHEDFMQQQGQWDELQFQAAQYGADLTDLPRDRSGLTEAIRRTGAARGKYDKQKAENDKTDRDPVLEKFSERAIEGISGFVNGDPTLEPIIDPATRAQRPDPMSLPLDERLEAMGPEAAQRHITQIKRMLSSQASQPMNATARKIFEAVRDTEVLPTILEYERKYLDALGVPGLRELGAPRDLRELGR